MGAFSFFCMGDLWVFSSGWEPVLYFEVWFWELMVRLRHIGLHGCNNVSFDFIYVLLLLYLRVGLGGERLHIYARFICFVVALMLGRVVG